MREILFKAKDFFTDEWVYGVPIKDSQVKGKWWMIESCIGSLTDDSQVKKTIISPDTICQEIIIYEDQPMRFFENDILRFTAADGEFTGILTIEDNSVYLKDKPLMHDLYALKYWLSIPEYFILSITGNIHDKKQK